MQHKGTVTTIKYNTSQTDFFFVYHSSSPTTTLLFIVLACHSFIKEMFYPFIVKYNVVKHPQNKFPCVITALNREKETVERMSELVKKNNAAKSVLTSSLSRNSRNSFTPATWLLLP